MPDPGSIIGQLRPPQLMTPADAINLRSLARQNELRELQLAEQQRQMQAAQQTRGIYQDPQNIDPQTGTLSLKGLNALAPVDPASFEQAGQQRRLALSQLSQQQLRQQQQIEARTKAMTGVGRSTVAAYDLALERTGGNVQEATRIATQARNDALKEMWDSGQASVLGFGDEDRAKAFGSPVNIDQLRVKFFSPEELQKGREPKSDLGKLRADLKAGRITQKEFDAAREKKTSFSLTGEGALSDDALNFAVDQFLAGDNTAAQGYARNAQMKAAFQNKLAERAKAKGMTGADLAAKVAEFQGAKAGQRTLGTRTANVEMAVQEAQNVIPIAEAASDKVNRTQYPTLNSILLAAEKGTGGEEVVRLAAATNSLINIYARAISPSGTPTVSDKDHAREILSTAYSKGQYRAAVDIMKQELEAARKSPGQVREGMTRTTAGREGEGGGWSDEKERRYQELLKKRSGGGS